MRSLPALGLVLLLTGVAVAPVCGLLFRCGCEAPWAGGAARCNVNRAGVAHCPWCEWPALGAASFGLTLAIQGTAFVALRRRGAGPARAGLVAAALLLPALGVGGALSWLATDYPHLLGLAARSRLGLSPGPLHCGGD